MMLRVIATSVPVRGALLAPSVALLAMPGLPRPGKDLGVSWRGAPLRPPHGTVTLRPERDALHLIAVRLPEDLTDDLPLLIDGGAGAHTALYGAELDPDPLNLLVGLEADDRWRLLEFLLNFCAAAFRLGRSPAFARLCARLAAECVRNAGTATIEAQVSPRHVLASGIALSAAAPLTVISARGIFHGNAGVLETGSLQIVPRARTGDLVIAAGQEPAFWTVQEAPNFPPLLALTDNGRLTAAAARNAVRHAFRRGPAAPAIQALLREMDALYPAPARKFDDVSQPIGGEVELAIPDHAGGLFLAGWVRDPLGLIEGISLEGDGTALPLETMAWLPRPDVAKRFAKAPHRTSDARCGFVAHVATAAGCQDIQPRLALRLRSGAQIELTPAPRTLDAAAARDLVLGYVAAGQMTPRIMRDCIAPAAARLHKAAMHRSDTGEVVHIGKRTAKPITSILVPLYRNLGFIRFQLAALAEDADCRRAEIIYVLDSPEQRPEAEHLLRGMARLTDLPLSLVVMPRNLGYAAANNTAAAHARAPILLLLNSDVVPHEPGWLQPLLAPFERAQVGAAGPKLLFEDGSIQHAGLFFERDEDGLWFNRHYHKGMPRHWPEAQRGREVPAVTGAALAIRRSLFQRLGGISEDYIIGDYEDSDLCLRVRAEGHSVVYVPEAELYHFERRSISLHAGYARTHASLYNRLLHQERWEATISALSSEPAVRGRRA